MKKLVLLSLFISVLVSCKTETKKTKEVEKQLSISEQVVELNEALNKQLNEAYIVNLDHHKMAWEEGVYTPPAIATIFSNPEVNTELIKQNPLIGIDLPFKTLCYSEADTLSVSFAYTSAEFIAKRHGLPMGALVAFENRISEVIETLEPIQVSETRTDSVGTGYGLITIKSDFDFTTTVANLKAIVNAQDDTRWFGEINYQKDAKAIDVELNPTTLLLFGGPAPGGKAMMTTPKIGLDAFCQKLLVYEKDNGEIWIAFNDIVAFAQLYYGLSTKPQQMINQRLTATFTQAVKDVN